MARSDYNKDGFSDFVWYQKSSGTLSQQNMAGGHFNIVGNFSWPSNKGFPWGQGDYNGDGYADVLTAKITFTGPSEWGWWKTNPGSVPTWQSLGSFSSDWRIIGLDQSDFTGDGTDDILWFNGMTHQLGYWEMKNGQAVRYQELTGFKWLLDTGWVPAIDDLGGTPGFGGDFNGDGRDDILLHNWNTHETGIAFASATSTSGLVGLGNLGRIEATGDFTGDRSADIIFNQNGNLYLYDMLNGAVSNVRYLGNYPGWDIVGGGTGDFTGDGVEDVVWRHNTTGEFGYWDFNGGDSSWPTWVSLGTAPLDWAIM